LLQATTTAFDFGEDVLRLGLPNEWLRVAIPRDNERLDGREGC
ncbi:MAG: hypothetical protein RL077_2080, partial [Verrucomicrobiota bacterium]